MQGKLRFIYIPVKDLKIALKFYRDQLGLDEAWREGESTVSFKLPDCDVQLMISTDPNSSAPGPMFEVPSLDALYAENSSHLEFVGEPQKIPGGKVVGVKDPSGNVVYLFDQEE